MWESVRFHDRTHLVAISVEGEPLANVANLPITSLLKPDSQLVLTTYFTTRVKGNPAKALRQTRYIDALETQVGIEIKPGSPPTA